MPSRTRGFTLVEILCTVSILAVAALTAIPFMSGNSEAKLSSITRSTISDLFYAQNLAITSQEPVFVLFSPANGATGGSYSLLKQNSSNSFTVIDRPDGGPFVVDFGKAAAGSVGSRCPDAQVMAIKQGGSVVQPAVGNSITYRGTPVSSQPGVMLGFDPMGQPILGNDAVSAAGKMSARGSVDLAAASDNSIVITLSIEPVSGEISIN